MSKYQNQKLGAIGRLILITVLLSFLLTLSLLYPERTERIARHLPLSRNGREYAVLLGILGTLVAICWGVLIGLVFTSPEQEVRFVRWTKRWRKTPIAFESIEFDPHDPYYRKSSWRYLLDRRRR